MLTSLTSCQLGTRRGSCFVPAPIVSGLAWYRWVSVPARPSLGVVGQQEALLLWPCA